MCQVPSVFSGLSNKEKRTNKIRQFMLKREIKVQRYNQERQRSKKNY